MGSLMLVTYMYDIHAYIMQSHIYLYLIYNTWQKIHEMGANLQSSKTQKIHFVMQKQVDFGKAVYVVGNIPQLGNWSIQKSLRLSWFKDDYWTGFITFPLLQLELPIQYKYVIANWDLPQSGSVEWEAGTRNRFIEAPLTTEHIICENSWNMEKITLNLLVPETGKNEEYSVIGDCKQLGSWKKSYKMKLNQRKNVDKVVNQNYLQNGNKYVVFSISFQIFRAKNRIHYYYIKKNESPQIERNPGRKYELATGFNSHSKCLKVSHPRGDTETFEICNFKELNYSKITENILLGAFLHIPDDFQLLRKQGVSSILSIQTSEDIALHRLTQDYLWQQSVRNDLEIHTYAIQDMNKRDFVQKCMGAIELLTKLVEGNKKVYVHCSAGMYRSPQIVVLFLILTQNYSLDEAINLVKSRHRFARPNPQTVNYALSRFNENKKSNIMYESAYGDNFTITN